MVEHHFPKWRAASSIPGSVGYHEITRWGFRVRVPAQVFFPRHFLREIPASQGTFYYVTICLLFGLGEH